MHTGSAFIVTCGNATASKISRWVFQTPFSVTAVSSNVDASSIAYSSSANNCVVAEKDTMAITDSNGAPSIFREVVPTQTFQSESTVTHLEQSHFGVFTHNPSFRGFQNVNTFSSTTLA